MKFIQKIKNFIAKKRNIEDYIKKLLQLNILRQKIFGKIIIVVENMVVLLILILFYSIKENMLKDI